MSSQNELGRRKQVILILISVLAILSGVSVTALIAYDCDDAKTDISMISLRDVQGCPKPESSYVSSPMDVQVVQRNAIDSQHVWTCIVEVTRLITHCGMHSHSSIVEGGLLTYIHRIGAEECRAIHRYRTWKIYNQVVGQITLNGTTTASLTVAGALDSTGACDGTTYHENGRTWKDVVITATIKIQTRDYRARLKLEENEISLLGGVTCPFLAGYCFDTTLGETLWEINAPTSCEDHLSRLYKGKADIVTNQLSKERYLVVEHETKIFAVTLVKRVILCNMEVWQTEHPKIVVVQMNSLINTDLSSLILPENTDLLAYINSKFLYVEQAYKRDWERLYIDTVHRRCLMQREILKNRLLMAPFSPNAVSQIVQNAEGYVGRVLGEVLYIMRCTPKVVEVRRTDRCYHELPVRVNNQSKFMAPVTRIIQNYAEEVDCNYLTPPLYFVETEWIGLTPIPTQRSPPRELAVEATPTLEFSPIQPIGIQGLYTQEEVSKVQRILTFGIERKAVENIVTRRIAGLDTQSQGLNAVNIFDPQEMKELATSAMRQLWGWFSDIGLFMSGLMGFYFIFRVIKYTLGVFINGLQLYQTMGCGLALLASFWNTLTAWTMHYHRTKRAATNIDNDVISSVDSTNKSSSGVKSNDELVSVITSAPVVYPDLDSTLHWTQKATTAQVQSAKD